MERFIGGKLPASSAHGATDVCLGVLFEDARAQGGTEGGKSSTVNTAEH